MIFECMNFLNPKISFVCGVCVCVLWGFLFHLTCFCVSKVSIHRSQLNGMEKCFTDLPFQIYFFSIS
jgi:hypothetical protein